MHQKGWQGGSGTVLCGGNPQKISCGAYVKPWGNVSARGRRLVDFCHCCRDHPVELSLLCHRWALPFRSDHLLALFSSADSALSGFSRHQKNSGFQSHNSSVAKRVELLTFQWLQLQAQNSDFKAPCSNLQQNISIQ